MNTDPNLLQVIASFTMKYLDPIGIWIGLILAFPIFSTWYQLVWGKKRQQKKWFEEIKNSPGKREGVLIVDLLPQRNIRAAVESYLQQNTELKKIPSDRIFILERNAELTADDMPDLANELRTEVAKILNSGVNKLHYFHAGPTVVAATIGAEFSNSISVNMYQHTKGKYENFGPLKINI